MYLRKILKKVFKNKESDKEPYLWEIPGHFYSPVTNSEEIMEHEDELFKKKVKRIEGIDLNRKAQVKLLERFNSFYPKQPFKESKQQSSNRYYFENDFFSYSDGLALYSMIREFRPKRIIEIGSGFSSAVMLDTNEKFFHNKINLKFIEPYPGDILNSVLEEGGL
ncbi:MAG: hypothetical protein Q9M91_00110 [Candidatus Dojkabacteria bacterium]|nr:hypothetical protein [Candidatus Dojkabacteria bacterium]